MLKLNKILMTMVAVLSLSACSEIELGSHIAKSFNGNSHDFNKPGHFKVGSAYKVKGRTYKPAESYQFTQTGIASWYGPGFHGKLTANGEVFNKNDLTAAHKTLQMPSIAKVTNLENGRSIIVRVNDRGPFANDRIIDLSEKAAEALDMKRQGTARVRVDVLEKESRQVASAAKNGLSTRGTEVAFNRGEELHESMHVATITPSITPQSKLIGVQKTSVSTVNVASNAPVNNQNNFESFLLKQANASEVISKKPTQAVMPVSQDVYVQAGAFSSMDNALTMKNALYNVSEPVNIIHSDTIYKVKIGPFETRKDADTVLSSLIRQGRDAHIIMVEK